MSVSAIAPARSKRGLFFDDFIYLDTSRWNPQTTGFGSVEPVGGFDPLNDEGLGLIALYATAGGETAVISIGDLVAGRLKVRIRARVRNNAAAGDLQLRVGLEDGQGAQTRARLLAGGNDQPNWMLDVASASGEGSALVDTGVPVAAAFVDVELVVLPGVSVTAFLNGAQVAQVTTAGVVPTAADSYGPLLGAEYLANSGGSANADFFEMLLAE